MSSNWILLTAGFGTDDMQGAARRVRAQAVSLGVFNKVVAVTNEDLLEYCPQMSEKYGEYLNTSHKGFGYFCWKIELVHSALAGLFGPCDGVVWVDAGCEIYKSPWTIFRLRHWMRSAEEKGTFVFSLGTPEQDFTKRSLFNLFPELNPSDRSPQFQATWFMLHGDIGRAIAKEWLRIALLGIETLDLSQSPKGEIQTFVEHRNEQSIFSLTLKKFGVKERKYQFYSGTHSFKSRSIARILPIWSARNRSEKSIISL
jgi:hypothetical protein